MLRSKAIFIRHASKPGILSNTLRVMGWPLFSSHAMKNYQNYVFPLFIKQSKIRKREIEIDLVMPTVTTEKATTPLLGFTWRWY